MDLQGDIKSPRLLRAKGGLFLLLGLAASVLLFIENFSWQRLGLFLIAIWAFCRFYYFLFYVLHHYAGKERPYAGLFDALRWAISGREREDR